MKDEISTSVTKILENFLLVKTTGRFFVVCSAYFDNCHLPCYIPLPLILKGKVLMFLFIIAFRLLKGSSLFTHLWFLSSGIELWHMLFTLNKYLLVERRIISSSAWIIFAISTEVWTLTFLRALIRQVYGVTVELFPRAGENCSGITCGPAFGVWDFGLCVGQQWFVWLGMECCSPKTESTRGRLYLGHLFWACAESQGWHQNICQAPSWCFMNIGWQF